MNSSFGFRNSIKSICAVAHELQVLVLLHLRVLVPDGLSMEQITHLHRLIREETCIVARTIIDAPHTSRAPQDIVIQQSMQSVPLKVGRYGIPRPPFLG
jgi:hypothetical protein